MFQVKIGVSKTGWRLKFKLKIKVRLLKKGFEVCVRVANLGSRNGVGFLIRLSK